jgi:hypothetical protein
VAWLSGRLQLAYIGITRDLMEGDLVSSLLLPGILDANVGHLDADPDTSRRHQALDAAYPDALRRPANALSIAHFLDIPRETARAKLTEMLAAGVLHRAADGYILPNGTLISEGFLPALPRYMEAFGEFVSGLALIRAFGLRSDSGLMQPVWPVAWAAMRLSTAHVLRETAYARALAPDLSLTASYILLTVCHGVSGHLRLASHMPVGAGALAVLRPTFGPVRSSTVSARLGLPEETVRRHLKRLVEIGFLCRTSRGYDIVHDGATLPAWRLYQKRSQANARQLIWRLTTTGVIPSSD